MIKISNQPKCKTKSHKKAYNSLLKCQPLTWFRHCNSKWYNKVPFKRTGSKGNLHTKIFLKPENEHFTLIHSTYFDAGSQNNFIQLQTTRKLRIIKSTKKGAKFSEENNFNWIIIKPHLKLGSLSLITELIFNSVC